MKYDATPSGSFPWYLFPAPPPLSNVTGWLAAVASKSNASWQVTYYSYDADGRVATQYTYTHANGTLTVLSTVPTTISYTRDLRDAVTQRALTVGASTWCQWYDYDASPYIGHIGPGHELGDGHRNGVVDPGIDGRLTYTGQRALCRGQHHPQAHACS